MTGQPHDSLFKAAFQQPENAAALARCNLPSSLSAHFDWSTMRLTSGSFVDEQLARRFTDLLFEVQTDFGEALVYLLFEHQSSNHPRMPLRMSRYMDRIWTRFDRQHASGPLPPIVPLLISHAPEGWTAPRSFRELFDPAIFEHAPELARFVPDFELLVDDLRRTSDDDLARRALAAFAKAALWLLRDGRAGKLIETMPKWVGLLEGLSRPSLEAIVNYVVAVANDPMTWEAFRANLHQLAPRAEGDVMTLTEQWLNQGEARMLTKLLRSKFGELPESARSRVMSASPSELEAWIERVLVATTLEQVLGEPLPR
ncbi:Rpn family recombination-promoting nuclease/putative transposase [Nannocystaceae bacterium ST9]